MVEKASWVLRPDRDTQPPPAGQMLPHATYPGIIDVVIEEAWIFCDHAGAIFWSGVELVQEFAEGNYSQFTGPHPFHGFDQCIWPQFVSLSSQLDAARTMGSREPTCCRRGAAGSPSRAACDDVLRIQQSSASTRDAKAPVGCRQALRDCHLRGLRPISNRSKRRL